jgi:hypothetical protein
MALQSREGSYDGLISTSDMSPTGIAAFAVANSVPSLVTSQGLCVKLDASNPGQFVLATATSDLIIGTLYDQPLAGQVGTIRSLSAPVKGYVQLGGTVAINSPLTIDAYGRAVVATQTTAGSQPAKRIIGYASEAGTVGAIIEFYPAGVGELF